MRYALSHHSKEILQRFVASKALLAFDFDGTLAPIVEDPAKARLRAGTRRLLWQVSRRYPCVVLSGRSRADLADKLVGTGISHTIGNHGAEPWKGARKARREVAGWKTALSRELASVPGVNIEDKKLSLTVHYRQSRRRAGARAEILKAVRSLPGVRLIAGKQAVSIVPKDAPHKGAALRAELARVACDRALFVGDDETDEDVFALNGRPPLFTIRVGQNRRSRAGYFLRGQHEVDELLRFLIEAGEARSRQRRARRGAAAAAPASAAVVSVPN